MPLSRKSIFKTVLLLLCVTVVTATIIVVVLSGRPATEQTADAVVAPIVTYSTDTPDEVKPRDDYNWQGSARDPKKISIPSLGINNYLQNVGVDQRTEVAVPTNIHLAGWFVDSVRPGDKGLSIIDGHLNGSNEDGIFANLEKIELGTTFAIEFGDGSEKVFKVSDVHVADLDKAADILFSQDPSITNQLNLVTCGGNYDRAAGLYDKRVIVVAELI